MTTPTAEELSNVKLAVQKLWDLDENRLDPGVDYSLNLPVGRGNTSEKLFEFVTNKVNQLPTYKSFVNLLDNYIPNTGIPEKVDDHELEEDKEFIKQCLQTSPMIYTYNYLKAKNLIKGNVEDFEAQLQHIWFDLYRREQEEDSSAFEHVFVGEVRGGKAKAFHNWIMFYFYEKAGKIDFEGFIPNRRRGNEEPDPNSRVITIRFSFNKAKKPLSTSFIGTSPEFELAMYTLLFYSGKEDTRVTLDGSDLNIKIYPFYEKGGNGERLIGSAFPMIV